ncbi:MAG TPA: hypothetical protein VHP83_20540 [Aggregatilineaceae bacterium]|nr:hypothetical protein [Aggregatilineaceae bacterium]
MHSDSGSSRPLQHGQGVDKNGEDFTIQANTMFKSLTKYQTLCLYQPNEEAEKVREMGEQIRCLRMSARYSRLKLIELLGVDLEMLTAVELGMGNLETAERLLELVRNTLTLDT